MSSLSLSFSLEAEISLLWSYRWTGGDARVDRDLYRYAVRQLLLFHFHFFILSARVPIDEFFFIFTWQEGDFFILGSVLSLSKQGTNLMFFFVGLVLA
jgi:hypothetical protein